MPTLKASVARMLVILVLRSPHLAASAAKGQSPFSLNLSKALEDQAKFLGSSLPRSPEGPDDQGLETLSESEDESGANQEPTRGDPFGADSGHGDFDDEVAAIGGYMAVQDTFGEKQRVPGLNLDRLPPEESTAESTFSQTESASGQEESAHQLPHYNNGSRSS